MAAKKHGENRLDHSTGVSVQMPKPKLPAYSEQIPPHSRRGSAPRAAKGTRLSHFLVVFLVITLAYVLFTIATMVPQARAHFLHLIISPEPAHFLKS